MLRGMAFDEGLKMKGDDEAASLTGAEENVLDWLVYDGTGFSSAFVAETGSRSIERAVEVAAVALLGRGTMHVVHVRSESELAVSQHAHFQPLCCLGIATEPLPNENPPAAAGAVPKEKAATEPDSSSFAVVPNLKSVVLDESPKVALKLGREVPNENAGALVFSATELSESGTFVVTELAKATEGAGAGRGTIQMVQVASVSAFCASQHAHCHPLLGAAAPLVEVAPKVNFSVVLGAGSRASSLVGVPCLLKPGLLGTSLKIDFPSAGLIPKGNAGCLVSLANLLVSELPLKRKPLLDSEIGLFIKPLVSVPKESGEGQGGVG